MTLEPEAQHTTIGKPQIVRLWDVFFLGPMIVYLGAKKSNLPRAGRLILVVSGALTIWYNGRNYLIQKELSAGEK